MISLISSIVSGFVPGRSSEPKKCSIDITLYQRRLILIRHARTIYDPVVQPLSVSQMAGSSHTAVRFS
jgi:hypothetical protein